jgi:hypothetical protein
MSKISPNRTFDQRLSRFAFFVSSVRYGAIQLYCNSIKYT